MLDSGYKAPKVYGKKKVFDARSADIWSLGIVLFMMTIGAPPFKRYVDNASLVRRVISLQFMY